MEVGESLRQRDVILKGLVCGADGFAIFDMLAKAAADIV
jgi:hypothetical protein